MENYTTNSDPTNSLRERDIVTRIWFEPRTIFRYINEHRHETSLWMLLVLNGIVQSFERAAQKHMGDTFPFVGLVLFCIVFGSLGGYISVKIYAHLISWTGRWLGGTADNKSLLRVFAYACIPSLVSLLVLIVQLGLYGQVLFQKDGISEAFDTVGLLLIAVQFILKVWLVVLWIVGTAEVQAFSIGKAIVNLLLPSLLLVALVLGFVLLVKLVGHFV